MRVCLFYYEIFFFFLYAMIYSQAGFTKYANFTNRQKSEVSFRNLKKKKNRFPVMRLIVGMVNRDIFVFGMHTTSNNMDMGSERKGIAQYSHIHKLRYRIVCTEARASASERARVHTFQCLC